jgi:DNA adenine methylase
MHYLGGKARIGKQIANIVNNLFTTHQSYLEPFMGAGWVLSKIVAKQRAASDSHLDLILLWKALQSGWIPPSYLSEEEYNELRKSEPSALRGFAGFGCSFSGKWFGGYARSGDRNYALNAKNSLMRKLSTMLDVYFEHKKYQSYSGLKDWVIYCDPPYEGTTKYKDGFNHEEFWSIMRNWSIDNKVIISEYKAPFDFECIAEFVTRTDLRTTKNGKEERIERLFQWNG